MPTIKDFWYYRLLYGNYQGGFDFIVLILVKKCQIEIERYALAS